MKKTLHDRSVRGNPRDDETVGEFVRQVFNIHPSMSHLLVGEHATIRLKRSFESVFSTLMRRLRRARRCVG